MSRMAALNEDIPRTCRAGCVVNVGNDFSVVLEDVPVPEPGGSTHGFCFAYRHEYALTYLLKGHDEILLRLSATGLCYTDIHLMLDDLPMPKMLDYGVRSPGHEAVGVVVKLGSNVKSWKIGDRGGVKPLWDVCSQCARCWGGQETYCKKAVHTGCMVTGQKLHQFAICIRANDTYYRNLSVLHGLTSQVHNSNPRRSG